MKGVHSPSLQHGNSPIPHPFLEPQHQRGSRRRRTNKGSQAHLSPCPAPGATHLLSPPPGPQADTQQLGEWMEKPRLGWSQWPRAQQVPPLLVTATETWLILNDKPVLGAGRMQGGGKDLQNIGVNLKRTEQKCRVVKSVKTRDFLL